MAEFIKKMLTRHREGVLYIFFGGVATVLSFVLFWAIDVFTPLDELFNNIIVWIICVTFQFVTNRFWVFSQEWRGFKHFLVQGRKFFEGRLATLLVEELILFIGIKLMEVNSLLVKAAAAIVIIILNYIISKVWVFRDGRKEERKSE